MNAFHESADINQMLLANWLQLALLENQVTRNQEFKNMQALSNFRNLKVSAIVPAYNEAKNIINVLSPLRQVPAIKEIIVVSDGSTDSTVELARNFGGVKVIALSQNVGKTKAVTRGVHEARHATILLCDADLISLNKYQISELIAKYCEGFDMVIMDKGSQPWVFKHFLQSVPAVSGTRILDKKHFLNIPFRETDRFQLEIRINDHFLDNDLTIAVTPAEEIHDPRKYVKYPFMQGLLLDLKGGMEVLASDGLSSIFKNLLMFRKIKKLVFLPVNQNKTKPAWIYRLGRLFLYLPFLNRKSPTGDATGDS